MVLLKDGRFLLLAKKASLALITISVTFLWGGDSLHFYTKLTWQSYGVVPSKGLAPRGLKSNSLQCLNLSNTNFTFRFFLLFSQRVFQEAT